MKNQKAWVPTKFEPTDSGWRGSRDPRNLAISSRITADSAVRYYETYLQKYCTGHLLDLGVGNAPLFGIYRHLASEITCVDWDESPHSIQHADIYVDLNEPLPLPSGRFDTILSTSVIEHLRNPEVVFSEIARILAQDGVAIVAVPFLYPIHEAPHDYYRYTEFCLRSLADDNGLNILSLETYGGRAEVILDLISKAFAKTPAICRALVWISEMYLRALRYFRKPSEQLECFPLGYIFAAQKYDDVPSSQ